MVVFFQFPVLRERKIHVRPYAYAAVYLNSFVFWDVTHRRLVSHRRFGSAYRYHLQGSRCRDRYVVPKRRCESNLRCLTSQKTTEFINVKFIARILPVSCIYLFIYFGTVCKPSIQPDLQYIMTSSAFVLNSSDGITYEFCTISCREFHVM
jgi:hypothetical protein